MSHPNPKIEAYNLMRRRRNQVFACPYCFEELPEEYPNCCGEAHGAWLETCGSCGKILGDDEECVDKGSLYKCMSCVEKG